MPRDFFWCLFTYPYWIRQDLIIIENRPDYAVFLRLLGYKGIIIYHLHNDVIKNFSHQYLEKINSRINILLSCSHALINPIRFSQPELYKKSSVIYNGVDETLFRNIKKFEDSRKVILYVGRLEENKGARLLIKAYESLLLNHSELELHIVGGNACDNISEYERHLKIDVDRINSRKGNITLHGYVDHNEKLPQLFQMATVFCLSSIYSEAQPMTVLEAMISRTSVVAANLGGVKEALGSTEFLFVPGNLSELVQKLDILLKSRTIRIASANKNHERALALFTWRKITNDFEILLNEAL